LRAKIQTPNFLHIVEGGDHSLAVARKQLQAAGETQENVDQRILEAISGFVDSVTKR
jgi:hypothetical protein